MFNCPSDFKHLAIIMDGNGRWAKKKGWPRSFGHIRGMTTLKQVVQACLDIGISYLTVFAFSTENWKRSSLEISVLMKLMKKFLIRYRILMKQKSIRLHILGDTTSLHSSLQELSQDIVKETRNNDKLHLIVAVNYGGRREITEAIQAIIKEVQSGALQLESVDENLVSRFLASSAFPPPNLIIRTGDVSRLSNFYLWSAAYSELYISSLLWPDFNKEELIRALTFYTNTQRRFGAATSSSMRTS